MEPTIKAPRFGERDVVIDPPVRPGSERVLQLVGYSVTVLRHLDLVGLRHLIVVAEEVALPIGKAFERRGKLPLDERPDGVLPSEVVSVRWRPSSLAPSYPCPQ